MLVDVSGDVQVDVIRSLQLMSMTILADEHGGADPFAVLEYALDPDSTDDVLLVNLGLGRRRAVRHERGLSAGAFTPPERTPSPSCAMSCARCARSAGMSRPFEIIDCAQRRPAR